MLGKALKRTRFYQMKKIEGRWEREDALGAGIS